MSGKEEFSRIFINYQILKNRYPSEFQNTIETFLRLADFYYNVAESLIEECSGKLTELACIHYPDFASVDSPVIKDYFKEINESVLFGIAYSMKKLVEDMKAKVDLTVKYPKMESWRDFYVHPSPSTMKEFDFIKKLYPDENERKAYVEKENREMKRFFLWEEKRKTEFYNIVQPVLMRLYPVLLDLEGDYWVLYAVNMRDEYEIWKSVMEDVEISIIYEMPPESVKWDHKKFQDEISKRFSKYDNISMQKRNQQIDSMKLEDEL